MKTKVIIAHGYWGRGGAEVVAMTVIEALTKKFEVVHVIARGGWDLNELNAIAGTNIPDNEIVLIRLPFKKILAKTTLGAIWHAIFLRYCRKIAHNYDIRITASRTMGWGLPAFHFLSDVVWNEQLLSDFGEKVEHQGSSRRILTQLGKKISGKSLNELHPQDVFIANSHWTANISNPFTTTKPVVVYPPVDTSFQILPWEKRSRDFVILGRISPEKNLETAIEIIEKVREKGWDINLTIYGKFENNDYSRSIKSLVQIKPWINAPGPVQGTEKASILPSFKFGINTCLREAFGISTAEMIIAGIIPFVPNEGGQREIVENDKLIFKDKEQAVKKIIWLLQNESYRDDIRKKLKQSKRIQSTQSFEKEIRKLIRD